MRRYSGFNRKTLVALALLVSSVAQGSCPVLTESQEEVLHRSYTLGSDVDLGWTLAAIAYQESSAGKFLVNVEGPAFGVHQVLLKSASRRMDMTSTWDKNRLAQRLMEDHDLSASLAIEELQFWQRLHGNNWTLVWASYYSGYNYRYKPGQDYAKKIASHIKTFKRCNILTED